MTMSFQVMRRDEGQAYLEWKVQETVVQVFRLWQDNLFHADDKQ